MSVEELHPGVLVRQECLERSGLSVTAGAEILGVSRQALSNLLTGKSGISPEMAIRLDLVFGGGAEIWLQHQLRFDLAEARKRSKAIKVRSINTQPSAHI
ncbi:TPA: HigA family addiction module antidote protein [Pseudomonas aeruginosa]|uniref:HigA family addiction module antitoxin n=1 Tax=Pseudomonas aeruginosa TaxID=287 RepID=UPI000FF3E4CD|nr:HigA family addiction module antitoxin [Pseudomonas aeruginosa]RWX85866.1 addiction module antidote protein, HigA family [Pseudomonas aeruginosa]HCF4204948.1 HigA family addiction module antidote protein [Pseudomonas aeruginosa]